jgi:hypothetical protein
MELRMEKLGTQVLIPTLDEVQPNQISLKSTVIQESPRAKMLSQYLCGTKIVDSVHIVHEVSLPDKNGVLQHIWARIICAATSIFLEPRLLKRLEISHVAAHLATLGLLRGYFKSQ